MQVADAGEEQLAVAATELADIRDPSQVGPLGGEVPLQQIRSRNHGGIAASTPLVTLVRPYQHGARPGGADPRIRGAP